MPLHDESRSVLAAYLPRALLACVAGALLAVQGPPSLHAAPGIADPAWQVALCAGRAACRATSFLDAGVDEAGQQLAVVQVALHEEAGGGGSGGGGGKGPAACLPYEYWLLMLSGEKITGQQLLLTTCNDGARPVSSGTDIIQAGPGLFRYLLLGGAAWKQSRERVLRLAPLQLVAESYEHSWVPGLSGFASSWSWESFSGSVSWYSPWCQTSAAEAGPAAPADLTYRYLPIPLVRCSTELQAGSWATTSLGNCALRIDSSGRQGFLLHGEPGKAEDALLKIVLVSEQDLLLEIHDDRWVSGSRSWQLDDHLQLWLGPRLAFDQCANPLLVPRQWSIRLADGRVFPGQGTSSRDRLLVERQEVVIRGGRTVMRLHILLPRPVGSITVAYSDGDDGRTQERVIATSNLIPGLLPTLGAAQPIHPRKAICEVRRDVLGVRLLPYDAREMPLLGTFWQ